MNNVSQLSYGTIYSATAGLCAFAGSLFGKLTGSNDHVHYIASGISRLWRSILWKNEDESVSHNEDFEILFIRTIFVLGMIVCNAGVWTFYVKALQTSKSSLPATLISSSTNFILSGVLGALIFEEATSVLWWSGAILVVIGLLLVSGKDEQKHVIIKKD